MNKGVSTSTVTSSCGGLVFWRGLCCCFFIVKKSKTKSFRKEEKTIKGRFFALGLREEKA